MEVIELLSESDVHNQSYQAVQNNEIIMYVNHAFLRPKCTNICRLSDDSELQSTKKDLESLLNDTAVPEFRSPAIKVTSSQSIRLSPVARTNDPRLETHPDMKRTPQSTKKSILDIGNWISSSEDDSFMADMQKQVNSQKPKPTLIKQVLNSSPVIERMSKHAFDFQSPRKAGEYNSPVQRSTKRLFVDNELSDPVSTSSVISSPPKPKRRLKSPEVQPAARAFKDKEWREANKVTRKKELILGEMVIEIASCLKKNIETPYFRQIFELPVVRNTYLEVPLISWKRRVRAKYNKDEDLFVPCELTEISERVLVLFYEADNLVEKIQQETLQEDVDKALARARVENPLLKYHLLIIVPGIREYLRKLQTIEDRQYREQMLEKMNEPVRKRKLQEVSITASEAQKLVHSAEVNMGINIFTSRSIEETIDWLHSFTYTIGAALYDKFERNPELANLGSVKLGSDQRTTFIEMVKKFNLMTAQKAEKLYEFYTSPASLYEKFCQSDSLGAVNGKNIIPPSVNAAMRRVFTSTDPSQVIND